MEYDRNWRIGHKLHYKITTMDLCDKLAVKTANYLINSRNCSVHTPIMTSEISDETTGDNQKFSNVKRTNSAPQRPTTKNTAGELFFRRNIFMVTGSSEHSLIRVQIESTNTSHELIFA